MMKTFETDEIIGSYRVVRPLGTGGMGMVYEVEHTKLKVHRALKVFAVENENVELHRKRFLSEGKMLSALDHPRVIRVHEFDVDARSGLPYFVMDLVLSPDGAPRTLEDERRAGMEETQAVRWFADVCEGLDYVHALGIVHRDVKLENVLIGPDGRAVLSDFGISRIFDDELRQRLDITLTMPQDEKVLNCLGSVHYLAPELQGANPEKATTSSDAWALGILLFRLLTGFWFENENREKCLKILDDYDLGWSPIVERLCAADPSERIPVGGFAALAPVVPKASALPPPKRYGWLWGAVAALAVAAGVVGYIAFAPVPPPIADYVLGQVVAKALTDNRADEQRARSRAADSDGVVIEIPRERQEELLKAEAAYLRRQLYDPVVKAFKGEPVAVQEKWKGVLTTAEILLDSIGGDTFDIRREFVGLGAVNAYTNGCRYPVPVAYAFASKTKQINRIQQAYSNLYVNIEHDPRWNAASRLQFFCFMSIVDRFDDMDLSNAPPSLTNACHEAHIRAMREFLVEKDFSPDEIGMVCHFASFCCGKVDLGEVLDGIRDDGIVLDPWLELMLRATAARNKAWEARGDGYANTVTPEGWRIYEEELAKALPLLEKAYHLRPEQPWSCRLALQCSFDDGPARKIWLKRLSACNQGLTRGLNFYLWALRPRWCGSNQQMVDFLSGLAQEQQFDTMIPIFAYERIITDVFASEGGLSLKNGEFPNVDKYILSQRRLFDPYFEGYRRSRLEERLPFIRKVHLYIALADLAWRLEDEKELLYWFDKFKSLGIPAGESHFSNGYWKYVNYLGALRKLEGAKRHDFLVGLHALDTDGNPETIDGMRKIAEEIGETQLAFECVLARKGKVNLRPFIKELTGGTQSGAKSFSLNFGGHQRDHMIFRFKLRSGKNRSLTRFHLDVTHDSNWLDRSKLDDHISVGGWRGEMRPGWVEWPIDEDDCSFEFEIVGSETRLTKNGVRLMEKSISSLPSLCRLFSVSGFFGCEISVLKFELEVLDGMDFVIPSEPRMPVDPKPLVADGSGQKMPTWLENNKKTRLSAIGGAECVLSLDAHDINEHYLKKTRPVIEGDEVYAMTDEWSAYDCPLSMIAGIQDACTVIFECGTLLKPFPKRNFVLGSFDLSKHSWGSNPDRVMVVVNPGTGVVYAIAQGNEKQWQGAGRLDLKAFPCALAFAYDDAHGLVAYQRVKDGSWVTLVACNQCHYPGEEPKKFRFGGCSRSGLPFKHLVGLTFRTVSVYPKVLSLEEMNELPNPISPTNPQLSANSKGMVIPVPNDIQAEVLDAEAAFRRRQFYDPVAKALEGEDETNRVAWASVLQTAEDMLKCFSEEEHVFTFYREYMGRGAEDAFKKGCSYPLPIAYAFSSLFKKKEYIQAAFQKAADNLEGDSRWNAATCLAFEYFFREKSSVSSVTNFVEREHLALRRFFKENEFSAKELGSVYRTLRLAAQHDAVIPVIKEVEAEGVKIDPWLKLMIDATDAYDRAWAARGSGFANTVTEEGWRIYHQEIVKVLPLLEKAYLMRPDLPQSTVVALSTCLGDREKMDLWLKRARASRADYCLAYGCYLWGLRPRWGGTTEEMADFILGVVKERHFESVSPIWAYENLVKYVFTYENGVEVVHQHFSNVNEFIKAERDIFEPYFEGYRKGQFYQKTDYINRVHIAVVLADLAWRLGNAEELLYWADEIEKLKVPVSVTEFDSGYKKYSKHLAALKKLTGYKRTSFMAGLRAMETDGDRAAIDAMIEIAREIGDTNLARDAAFARRGKTDLLPFLIGQPGLMAGSRVHDHLIFRVSVAEVEKDPRRLASFKIYVTSHQVNPETNNYITDTIEVSAGPFRPVVCDQPVWNHKEKSCSFEVEIVGNLVRLTQDGRRILEKRLHARPSNSKYFFLAANEVPGLKFTKIEWEARDDAAFVIPSEKREITIVEPPKVPQVATFPKYNLNKISMLPPPKGVSPICWSFCQPGEWREWRTQLSGGADLESTPSPVFRINTIPHGDNQTPIGGVLVRNVGSRTEGLDGATLVFNYADLDAGKLRDDFILASMTTQPDALRFNPKMTNLVDRLMIKCDPKTGIVSAVAQDNVKRWSGTEPMDLSSPTSCIIVTYDYAHGLSAYQRTEKGQPWRKLVSAPLCRYRNEKSTLFSIGGPIRRTSQGAQGKVETGLQGALILSAALYPKVFTPKDFER